MAISFGETFNKVQECFQEPAISSQLTPNLQSVTIIRDVYGAIRLYLEPVKGSHPQAILGDFGETLRLLPAGAVDNNYLEKLARLDFQNLVDNQLPDTLREMLRELESAARPLDFILLDARAGFHDLGGLAIADLSHAVVIFGTQSRQSWAGFTHVIRRLARPLAQEQLPVLLVHALAPALSDAGRVGILKAFADQAYQIFQTNYYYESEMVPNINDRDAPFTPVVLPLLDDLRGDIALFARDESPAIC